MLMEKYKFIEKLGRGTHGTVYLLESKCDSKANVVCKSVLEKHIDHARKEVAILSELNHRRVVKLMEFIQAKGSSFIILEYADRGTLDTVIKFFIQKNRKATIFLLWSIFSQVVDGLMYLHSKNIIHRDIKPSNILIRSFSSDENEEFLEFVLCDFSLSVKTDDQDGSIESSIVGTPFYMSPEMICREKYNNTIDIWGLGVTMYEVNTLRKPFSGETRRALYSQIRAKHIQRALINDLNLETLVLSCLQKQQRPSAKSLWNSDTVKLYLANHEIKVREVKIKELENKLKQIEKKISWPPTPK